MSQPKGWEMPACEVPGSSALAFLHVEIRANLRQKIREFKRLPI
jgi:hypothetical protein